MEDKMVILQNKRPNDFTVNYPYGERGNKEYKFMGTKGAKIYERPIPMEVVEWLSQNTKTFELGYLIIKPNEEDDDINYLRENISDIDKIEESVLLKDDIIKMLKDGNQNVLKKKLNELIKDKSEELVRSIKDQIMKVATEIGVDSAAKRKVICDFAGLDYEMVGDVLFESEQK
ncbi:MAG: hypothetical protein J6D47_02370 [Peptostreptococcaceae bacterium]|nr:hypothetical protein [Peptostreptococcaceae bacterium]